MFDEKTALATLTSDLLTHEQKMMGLAKHAENGVGINLRPEGSDYYFQQGSINDLFEGDAPYRPRYILPDYEKFVKQGSEFLQLSPPQTFQELIFSLMILYRHVPSITNFPVYLGNLDTLIEPFIGDLSDEEVKAGIRHFFIYLDRTITDSFCHANIGPEATRAGELILEVDSELKQTVPNLTLKYDTEITPPAFAAKAVAASLECSNPAICNHRANLGPFGEAYGISSCYNILATCGGAYTLTRLTLTKLAELASGVDDFLNRLLPEVIGLIGTYMNNRIRFLVEQSGFFQSSFLVKEGLIDADRFVAMFGVTGLAEAVNLLFKDKDLVYGRDEAADELAEQILIRIESEVDRLEALYSPLSGGKFLLHAQVGLDSDLGITSGVRIPVGSEPESFFDHLRHSARYHRYFPAGVGDIFPIATDVENNPEALVDVVRGAFGLGVHYMSFYAADTDLVRITGYLVKRSEMEKFREHSVVLQNTTHLGAPNYEVNRLAERKVRMS